MYKTSSESQPVMHEGSSSSEEAQIPAVITSAEVLQLPAHQEIDPVIVSGRAEFVGTNVTRQRAEAAANGDFAYAA